MADEMEVEREPDRESAKKADKMFTLKKWNLVAMWSWDVECDTCAICRVQVMGKAVYRTASLQGLTKALKGHGDIQKSLYRNVQSVLRD